MRYTWEYVRKAERDAIRHRILKNVAFLGALLMIGCFWAVRFTPWVVLDVVICATAVIGLIAWGAREDKAQSHATSEAWAGKREHYKAYVEKMVNAGDKDVTKEAEEWL